MIYWMRILALLLIAALSGCERSNAHPGVPPAPEAPAEIDMLEFGNFEYVERMKLPDNILRWNGKLVRATGYMNPGRQVLKVKEFELVMNKNTCCYGSRPKMNHFFQVGLLVKKKEDLTVFTSEPITVTGRFVVEETWDGDWQLGLYWLKDAKVVK